MQIKLKKKIIETHHKNMKEIQLDAIKVVLSLHDVRISVVKFTFNNFLITCVFCFKNRQQVLLLQREIFCGDRSILFQVHTRSFISHVYVPNAMQKCKTHIKYSDDVL